MNHPVTRPLVYAHRGARAEEPENTLRSYRRALALGADGIELDVRVSADGHLVVIHDKNVDRTTDGSGPIAELTLAEIKELDAGQGERIPTFDEAMEVCGDLVQVEIKALEAVQALAERERRTPLPGQVVLTSFSRTAVEEAARLLPHVPRGLISHHPGAEMLQSALDLKATWVCPELKPELTRELVDRCHAAGVQVDAWPAADRGNTRLFADIGADAVTTDHPGRIAEWLTEGDTGR
ncbi:glycerophosphoryl diester phosphodiesterase [Streptomyces sulfonofaciens]|uniref:Glycerophosphoryl diester phosphodiesterase n=1 Tax=Streptomyces sulfonofaciens TaxID=68272 RepID=A0A919G8N9_9ACTN|nr:glycerophosphodiester phosphodiesterase [Streptomyces sulfonofaciens]GHH79473.1 glycerophosphoryl diester phosphodiesterase [Streptomyces sulfonofaciens]